MLQMLTSLDFIVRDTLNSGFSLFSKTDFHASALLIQSIQISAEVYKFVNCSLKQFLTLSSFQVIFITYFGSVNKVSIT